MTRRNSRGRKALPPPSPLNALEAELHARAGTRVATAEAPAPVSTTTPVAVAQWMLNQIERQGRLYQAEAAREIAGRFGDEFTFATPDGRLALGRRVLRAFKKIAGDSVVWEHGAFCWRWREAGDAPGRHQGKAS